jgi:hypothetical protein
MGRIFLSRAISVSSCAECFVCMIDAISCSRIAIALRIGCKYAQSLRSSISLGTPYWTSFSLTDLRMPVKFISGHASIAPTSASKRSTIAPKIFDPYDLPGQAICENDLRKVIRFPATSRSGYRANSIKWCKQTIGIQLASRRDDWTSRAEARSLESEAKASLAQEASTEESIATNRGIASSTSGSSWSENFPLGCSKRPSSKAAKSGATEAYPRGYVAGRHRTENDAGGLFQQPLRFDGDVHKRRHRVRSLLVRHPQLEPVGPFF